MVARTPPKQPRRMAVAPPLLSPTLLRETVKKVDRCMARLQELQYAVNGGNKLTSGVSLRTSLRPKTTNLRRSPPGKLPAATLDEWRRMSVSAMLLGETMGEILQASQFARNVVEAVSSMARNPATDDPKTPATESRKKKPASMEDSGLCARRRWEKQVVRRGIRSESNTSSIQRAKCKINFKASPPNIRECEKENCRYIANRVSPRNRPWVRKTVLFPNPLFHSSPNAHHQRFCKTKSPVISRNRQTPHKFLVKSPPTSKFQVKIKSPPVSVLPGRATTSKKSPEAKLRRSFSPSRIVNRLVSPLRGRKPVVLNNKNEGGPPLPKQRRSFSPSRLAERLIMSPLKIRKSSVVRKEREKETVSMRFSSLPRRI